jgi:RNA polymerase sigma-70 factor (ECF subfamily)
LQPSQPGRFEATVLPHLDSAYTLARYLMRDEADAQDAVQDAALRALTYFDGFRGGDARAWLLRIVRNACHDVWRRRPRTTPLTDDLAAGESPEDALLGTATHDALRAAIDALPPEFREVIVLREIEGLSYAEIAEVAEVPAGTVMSRLARARKRLQEALNPAPREGWR